MAHIVGDEELHTHGHVLVEPFHECQCEGILESVVACVVVDGVAESVLERNDVEGLGVVVAGGVVGDVRAVVGVKLQVVYEACHGDVLVLQPRRVVTLCFLLG